VGQDRTKYQNDRILIEAARILAPQFKGTTITIDGAQVELLRNIVSYLHQERTFVSEYHGTYYLTASDADFDEIEAIVADLEEKLMGNPNTVWGYSERWFEQVHIPSAVAGWNFLETEAVPAGYVYRSAAFAAMNQTTNPTAIQLGINVSGTRYYVERVPLPGVDIYVGWQGNGVYKPGDKALAAIGGCEIGDVLIFNVWGYKMKV
jgi:hypothetical protein